VSKKKTVSWADIENRLKDGIQNGPGETEAFKKAILSHLDNLQAEEDKKVIPFSQKREKQMELSDLELFERTPDSYYGKDKDGNEYGIGPSGKLTPVEKGSIWPNWYHASIEEVKQYIEIQKKLELERSQKKQKSSPKKNKKKPEILPPDISGFTTYFERISHGLVLTNIMFTETRIIITDSTDYFDSDSERDEYYIIEPDSYLELIKKLEKEYKPIPVKNLSPETRTYYNFFKNETLKKIFLLTLSIIGYDRNIKDETEKYMRGDEIIKLLCGDKIKFKQEYYSKGL
jgi:hypothetical protein